MYIYIYIYIYTLGWSRLNTREAVLGRVPHDLGGRGGLHVYSII